jgi:crotonobetainyl-CoA:carnitine CoA-transferase CaiB-like acyl-CoA transferase
MQKKALTGLNVVGFVTAGVGPMLAKSLATHGTTVIIIGTSK